MNVTVDSLRFNAGGCLQVKKNGEWRVQVCMHATRHNEHMYCGLQCPLCHQDFDGCVILCQDRQLLPMHTEEKPKKK